MATYTQLYLLNTAAPFAPTNWQGGWDQVNAAVAATRCLSGEKEGNGTVAVPTLENTTAVPWRVGVCRGISPPLAAQNLTGLFDTVLGIKESSVGSDLYWRIHAYVTVGDTDAVRGTLIAAYEENVPNEWPTTATATALAAPQTLAGVLCQAGDRLVVELGFIGRNPLPRTGTIQIGATTGASSETALPDLVLGSTAVTLNAGFVTCSLGVEFLAPPVNDACADATLIEATPFTETIDIRTATRSSTDPAPLCRNRKYHSVWWTWTPISNSNATLTATVADLTSAASFDVTLSVWTGACGALTQVACSNGSSPDEETIVFVPTIGVPYRIMVSLGVYGGGGQLTLSVTQLGGGSPLANATCASATAIGALPYTDTVDTSGDVTTDPNDPTPTAGGTPHKTAWWSHVALASVWHRIHTTGSAYTTQVSVWTGACGSLTEVESGVGTVGTDPQTEVFFLATAGTQYFIMVGAVNGDGGSLDLFVSQENPPGLGGPGTTPRYEGAMGMTSTFGYGSCFGVEGFSAATGEAINNPPIFVVLQGGANLIRLYGSTPTDTWPPPHFLSIGVVARWYDPLVGFTAGPFVDGVLLGQQLNLDLSRTEPDFQTLEMRWRLSTRSFFDGSYATDGFIEVRVDGAVVQLLTGLRIAYPAPWAPGWSGAFFGPHNSKDSADGHGGADRVYLKDRAEYCTSFTGADQVCNDADLILSPASNRTPGVPVADGFNTYTDFDAPPSVWTRVSGEIVIQPATNLTIQPGIGVAGTPGMTDHVDGGAGTFCSIGLLIGDLVPRAVSTCPPGTVISVLPTPLPDGIVGVPYSQMLTASGGTPPYAFSVFSGTLPAGLTLAPTGALSGTPLAATVSVVTIVATDANGCTGTTTLIVLAAPCPPITISPSTLPTFDVGVPYSQQLSASGGTGPYTFTLCGGAFPSGISMDASGLISGTPTDGDENGSFTICVSDANGCPGSLGYVFGPTPPPPGGTVCPPREPPDTVGGTACVEPVFP